MATVSFAFQIIPMVNLFEFGSLYQGIKLTKIFYNTVISNQIVD